MTARYRLAKLLCLLLLSICWSLARADGEVSVATARTNAAFAMGFYLPSVRDANRADLRVSLQSWADTMGRQLGMNVVSTLYEDMATLRRAVESKQVQLVNSSGMEMVEAFSADELGQGFTRHRSGVDEGLVLLVNATSGIHRFSELKGRQIVRLGNDRLYEVFLELQCLKATGDNCGNFARISEEKQDVQSLYRLFFGKADAALVSLATLKMAGEMNPQVSRRLTGILEWKAKGIQFGMLARDADPTSRDMLLNSVGEIMASPSGKQILELFKTDSLVAVDAIDLQPFRDLLADYRSLSQRHLAGKR